MRNRILGFMFILMLIVGILSFYIVASGKLNPDWDVGIFLLMVLLWFVIWAGAVIYEQHLNDKERR